MAQQSKLNTPKHFIIPLSPQLYRLAILKDGWDGEGSKAITREALEAISSIKVSPTRDGGVELRFTDGCSDHEIHFSPEGVIDVYEE